MRGLIAVAAVVLVLVIAVVVLGVIGPFVAGIGVVAALVVAVNPRGMGSRLRQSPGWWAIPGMRRASRGAAPFALLLLLYAVPAPMIAFAVVHSVHGATSPAPVAGLGVGGGGDARSSATPSASGLATGTAGPAATPVPTATPVPVAKPVPTAPPAPTSTLQPIPVVTLAPTATPAPTAPPPPPPTPAPRDLCGAPSNPWNYNFCGGAGRINSPPSDFCSYFTCIASFWQQTSGYVEQCNDGTYSHSGGVRGSCSGHGGNRRPLNP